MAKLLVVDDQEANRYMLEVLLKGHGHTVVTASNGVEALASARQEPPEVIITDILMPEMDGFALCRAWKSDPNLSRIPLIFYTATYTDPKDEKFALSLGAERFIIKPTEPVRFMEILGQVLEEHREGKLAATVTPLEEEGVFLREYNQALIHKLEDKIWQLEQANKRLVQEVEERKRTEQEQEKLRAQLIQSQKMESLGTLAGGIAHDFNNLLSVMTGFTELALGTVQSTEVISQHLREVIQAGERAKNLVKKILTFSRLNTFEMKPLDLNKEVRQAVILLERTLPKMINVHTHLADDLKPINGDANELEQILINLATNAQDAMPQGGSLILETSNVRVDEGYNANYLKLAPGEYVLLQVSDTGQGMDALIREQIFDPFFTTKDLGKGTGLGLSTVYGIVKSHGGHISCYSEPGNGTTFKIFLPVFHDDDANQTQQVPEQRQPVGGNESILLVDDEKLLLELGETILSQVGYRVMTAQSGEEALDIYREHKDRLDLVITDLGMPGMGGYKTLKTILEINPQAKVVIASGYMATSHVKTALESGAAGYVAKPFGRMELLTKIREELDRK